MILLNARQSTNKQCIDWNFSAEINNFLFVCLFVFLSKQVVGIIIYVLRCILNLIQMGIHWITYLKCHTYLTLTLAALEALKYWNIEARKLCQRYCNIIVHNHNNIPVQRWNWINCCSFYARNALLWITYRIWLQGTSARLMCKQFIWLQLHDNCHRLSLHFLPFNWSLRTLECHNANEKQVTIIQYACSWLICFPSSRIY